MQKQKLNNRPYLKDRRRELRNNLTPAEAALWTLLKNSQLQGRKFRRQHSIDNYIADFYCPAEKLIIELDGEVHNDPIQSANDVERSEHLQSLGYTVIRFENKLVFQQTEWVLEEIAKHFKQ